MLFCTSKSLVCFSVEKYLVRTNIFSVDNYTLVRIFSKDTSWQPGPHLPVLILYSKNVFFNYLVIFTSYSVPGQVVCGRKTGKDKE